MMKPIAYTIIAEMISNTAELVSTRRNTAYEQVMRANDRNDLNNAETHQVMDLIDVFNFNYSELES